MEDAMGGGGGGWGLVELMDGIYGIQEDVRMVYMTVVRGIESVDYLLLGLCRLLCYLFDRCFLCDFV